ncbi:MAG: hypothetical protein ACHRHE_03180 [Tepidisphaerales bacterium]
MTGDFPYLPHSDKPDTPFDPNAGPDPKEGIQSDPLGNAIISGLGDFGVGLANGVLEAAAGKAGDVLLDAVRETAEAVAIDHLVDKGQEVYAGAKESGSAGDAHPEMLHTGTKTEPFRDNERRALLAVTTANQRYRAATAAGDAVTMQKELQNAVAAAVQAKAESRKAILAHLEMEIAAQASTDQAIAALEKKGIHLPDALAQWQQSVRQAGLPPELVNQLQTAGFTTAQIEKLRQTIVGLTPARIQAGLEARRDRLAATQAVRKKLETAHSQATWPEPPELGKIEELEHQVRAALQEVSRTRIDLAPPAGVAPEKLPKWWAVPAGSALGPSLDPAGLHQAASSGPLMPGTYDIYANEVVGAADQPIPSAVRLAKGVLVAKGHPTTMPLNTGISLQLPKDLPAPYCWFVLLSDSNSTIPFSGRADGSADPLLLPAGKYDVYWVQTQRQLGRPVLVASEIDVKAGGMITVPIASSSIRLDVGPWVPARDATYGWWGIVRAGDPPAFAIRATAKQLTLFVLPGRYHIYWVQDYDHEPLMLASGVEARENGNVTVAATAGITLDSAAWVPPRHADYGRWGVVLAGTGPPIKALINWSKKDDPLLLPPAIYDVYWVQDYDHAPFLLAGAVEVKPNARTTVAATAGIALDVADWVPPRHADYGRWGVVPAGTRPPIKEFINWSKKNDPLLLPPATYDVYWVDRYGRDPFLLTANVDATGAKLVHVKAATGIRLKVPPTTPAPDKGYGFWGVIPSGQEAGTPNIRSDGRFDLPLLVPAGTYDIVWKQNYDAPITVVKKSVKVSADAASPIEAEVQPPPTPAKH